MKLGFIIEQCILLLWTISIWGGIMIQIRKAKKHNMYNNLSKNVNIVYSIKYKSEGQSCQILYKGCIITISLMVIQALDPFSLWFYPIWVVYVLSHLISACLISTLYTYIFNILVDLINVNNWDLNCDFIIYIKYINTSTIILSLCTGSVTVINNTLLYSDGINFIYLMLLGWSVLFIFNNLVIKISEQYEIDKLKLYFDQKKYNIVKKSKFITRKIKIIRIIMLFTMIIFSVIQIFILYDMIFNHTQIKKVDEGEYSFNYNTIYIIQLTCFSFILYFSRFKKDEIITNDEPEISLIELKNNNYILRSTGVRYNNNDINSINNINDVNGINGINDVNDINGTNVKLTRPTNNNINNKKLHKDRLHALSVATIFNKKVKESMNNYNYDYAHKNSIKNVINYNESVNEINSKSDLSISYDDCKKVSKNPAPSISSKNNSEIGDDNDEYGDINEYYIKNTDNIIADMNRRDSDLHYNALSFESGNKKYKNNLSITNNDNNDEYKIIKSPNISPMNEKKEPLYIKTKITNNDIVDSQTVVNAAKLLFNKSYHKRRKSLPNGIIPTYDSRYMDVRKRIKKIKKKRKSLTPTTVELSKNIKFDILELPKISIKAEKNDDGTIKIYMEDMK